MLDDFRKNMSCVFNCTLWSDLTFSEHRSSFVRFISRCIVIRSIDNISFAYVIRINRGLDSNRFRSEADTRIRNIANKRASAPLRDAASRRSRPRIARKSRKRDDAGRRASSRLLVHVSRFARGTAIARLSYLEKRGGKKKPISGRPRRFPLLPGFDSTLTTFCRTSRRSFLLAV